MGVRATVMAVAAVGMIGACGGDDEATAAMATAVTIAVVESVPGTLSETVPATVPVTEATPPASDADPSPSSAAGPVWQEVAAPEGCQCSDGSEFSFWVREADPDKVVLYFQGGGACFSAETCDPAARAYKTTTGAFDDPTGADGIFDFANPDNPIADYSVVYVPYCTGDVHIGSSSTVYTAELTVEHNGFVNASAALDHLVEAFPDAARVVVTGESAGSIPSPLFAGLVSDRLPDASILSLGDGSGAYPDIPGINALIGGLWGTQHAVPDWPENVGMTPEKWSFPALYIQSGRHDPDIVFARHDFAFDETQEFFATLAGIPADELVTLIDANETQIEAAGVEVFSFIEPGDDHTILSQREFYTAELNGVRLVDWVTALVNGEQVEDVHCVECER